MAPAASYRDDDAIIFGAGTSHVLGRVNSRASVSSRASTLSKARDLLRSLSFRREATQDSKGSTSSGTDSSLVGALSPAESKKSIATVTAVSYVPADRRNSLPTGKKTKPRSGKVPMADLVEVTRQLSIQAQERRVAEAQLARTSTQLDLEQARAAEAREQLERTLGQAEGLQEELAGLAEQLQQLELQRAEAEARAADAQHRAREDRLAAEKVYDMYVSLLMEHNTLAQRSQL